MLLFVTGGCRSGKSAYAQQWVHSQARQRVYMATAFSCDAEMGLRIHAHKNQRGPGWSTLEPSPQLWETPEHSVQRAAAQGQAILFDCLTLWVAHCFTLGFDAARRMECTRRLLLALKESRLPVALVSNELGMGLVPENALGREFRDAAGLANQCAGQLADAAVFMVSGLPLYCKGQPV